MSLVLSPEQEEAFYLDSRLLFVAGGEGSGKSFLGALTGVVRSISDAHDYGTELLYWIVGADFEDARMEFDYVLDWYDQLKLVDRKGSSLGTRADQKVLLHSSKLKVTFETVSAYDPLKIGREQPDGIIGCEVSRWEKEVYDRVYGRLARKRPRSWGFFSGSFETSVGWFPETFELGQGPNDQDVRSISLPSWANRVVYPGGYDDPAIQQLVLREPPARFRERYGGAPSPPQDAVLPEFRNTLHVTNLADYDPHHDVVLYVDPGGSGGAYAVLFVQHVDDVVRIVDELYVNAWTHEQIINGCRAKPAWKTLAPRGHVMDVGGSQQHAGMQSALQGWQEDTGIAFLYAKRSVEDQVEKLRSTLSVDPRTQRPYLQIHPRARGLIAELGGGPSPLLGHGLWRHKAGIPNKTNCDSAKALAYGLLMNYGRVRAAPRVTEEGDLITYSYLKKPSEQDPAHNSYLVGAFNG